MKTISLFTTVLVASSILATPALSAQKRKTLFEVLFPKAHEQRLKRQRERELALRPTKVVKVKTSRNYVYKVVPRTPINIKPKKIELAAVGAVNTTGDSAYTEAPAEPIEISSPSLMTRDLVLLGKLDLATEKHLAAAVSTFYSDEQRYQWINEDGEWNARARSVLKLFARAEEYGLYPEDYIVEVTARTEDPEKAVAQKRLYSELAMTNAALRYAMDARFGTINPNKLSGYHDLPVNYGKTPEILDQMFSSGLPANTLRAMHPSNEKFKALQAELVALANVEDDVIDLPTKILIKPGNTNEFLADFIRAIQARASSETLDAHKAFLSSYDGSPVYSKEAVALVKAYQKEAGLGADGIIGRNTASKLAGIKSEDREMQVKLSMERLRWLPKEFGKRHVFINQPEYRARYIESGKEKLSMRVVVGKKSNQTNFFYDEIEHVVYNPYWGVPRSIIVNEFRPKSLGNPGYLDQLGYEVSAGGRQVSSSSIDWYAVSEYPNFDVRQPPGARNALGELKIMFPNKHAIYMHDTPAKSLFKKQHRAFSHGCIRLHDPHAMAAAVMGKSEQQIRASIATGQNQTEKLRAKVPVYVSYFTAWPQQDGSVKYFRDMYGRDAHLIKAIDATRKARSVGIAS
ncbi:MAG: L,D-transpeptidase family protein [Pseudomonadota bacterium]